MKLSPRPPKKTKSHTQNNPQQQQWKSTPPQKKKSTEKKEQQTDQSRAHTQIDPSQSVPWWVSCQVPVSSPSSQRTEHRHSLSPHSGEISVTPCWLSLITTGQWYPVTQMMTSLGYTNSQHWLDVEHKINLSYLRKKRAKRKKAEHLCSHESNKRGREGVMEKVRE